MTREEAVELQRETNIILSQVYAERFTLSDASRWAVNWGDLHCTDVEVRTSLLTGSKLIVVIIEEVSPDAEGFKKLIGDELEKRGYKDVFIVTEW